MLIVKNLMKRDNQMTQPPSHEDAMWIEYDLNF